MKHERWSTRSQQVSERAAFWSTINVRYFGRLHVASLDDDPLDATLETYEVGALRMYRIEAPAHRVHRDASCGELPMDAAYKLVLQVRGRGIVEQQNRCVPLQPAGWVLYDPHSPYAITNRERCTLLVAQVPRALLGGLRPGPHFGELGHGNVAGLHGVFGSYLSALSDQLPTLPDGVGSTVSESVLGLLASTLAEQRGIGGEPVPLPSVLRMRVRHHVQAHLSDPDLSIPGIAQALRCSTRYLHKVFEDDDTSLERLIWTARLERCRAALVQEANADRSAAEIAFAWGFKSSAHFCRLFKRHYGITPGACQRQAGEATGRATASSTLAPPLQPR
jgi:AraC-like DNA-binding protein